VDGVGDDGADKEGIVWTNACEEGSTVGGFETYGA
jgi:hypothetical protein